MEEAVFVVRGNAPSFRFEAATANPSPCVAAIRWMYTWTWKSKLLSSVLSLAIPIIYYFIVSSSTFIALVCDLEVLLFAKRRKDVTLQKVRSCVPSHYVSSVALFSWVAFLKFGSKKPIEVPKVKTIFWSLVLKALECDSLEKQVWEALARTHLEAFSSSWESSVVILTIAQFETFGFIHENK